MPEPLMPDPVGYDLILLGRLSLIFGPVFFHVVKSFFDAVVAVVMTAPCGHESAQRGKVVKSEGAQRIDERGQFKFKLFQMLVLGQAVANVIMIVGHFDQRVFYLVYAGSTAQPAEGKIDIDVTLGAHFSAEGDPAEVGRALGTFVLVTSGQRDIEKVRGG